ncbi:MAG: substrate-binding domain-containing protein [Lachnospiraceae bacterium]
MSLVYNDKPGVNIETRKRIGDLLKENGYKIHDSSQVIPTIKRTIIFARYKGSGHLFEAVDDFFSKVFDGIDLGIKRLGYNLNITNISEYDLPDFIHSVDPNDVDGIIFLASEYDPAKSNILQSAKVPVVLLDSRITSFPINTIAVENLNSVYQALQHLVSLGHTKIGYLCSNELTGAIPERQAAFTQITNALGIAISPSDILSLPIFVDECYHRCLQAFQQNRQLPTAFFADNDIIATGALRAFSELNIHVPEDVSVIGFDDSLVCTLFSPALTTMRIPKQELGYLSVMRLHEIIEGDSVIRISMVPAELVLRASTAPPRTY